MSQSLTHAQLFCPLHLRVVLQLQCGLHDAAIGYHCASCVKLSRVLRSPRHIFLASSSSEAKISIRRVVLRRKLEDWSLNMPNVKYSKLTDLEADDGSAVLEIKAMTTEETFNFDSIYDYDEESKKKYGTGSKNTFNSAFKYTNMTPGRPRGHLAVNVNEDTEKYLSSPSVVATSYLLTFLSYVFFVLTLPLTYWIIVKKLGEFDRLVVFRLGKMIGVKGPGRVLVFPWMDRTKKVDVRAAAFSVPPQQFITSDGGIVEVGGEIQYGIVDVVTMVSEVADHQDILRSLSKTLLVKNLVKKSVRQIEKDRRRHAAEIQDELNLQVRQWGIDVQKVELSDPKILKQPENSSHSAVGSILKGLGMKDDPKYPTPEEFVKLTHGSGVEEESSGSQTTVMPPDMNVSLLQMMASNIKKGDMPGIVPPTGGPAVDPKVFSWGKCLESILQNEFSGPLDEDSYGLYKLEINTQTGDETYFIHLSPEARLILAQLPEDHQQPDVAVQISSADLASVLEGTLAPLQAYLTGRISASGDVRKLMLFDKFKKTHKPGTMFSV